MAPPSTRSTRGTSSIKRELDISDSPAQPAPKRAKKEKIKKEEVIDEKIKDEQVTEILDKALPLVNSKLDNPLPDAALYLQQRKLKTFASSSLKSPYPNFPQPTASAAKRAHAILIAQHGARIRPKVVVANPNRAGCGDSPSVLDALVRTILSQNTSDVNSARAKRALDAEYGGPERWSEILAGGVERLEGAIRSGGLAKIKSKVILNVLQSTQDKYGKLSLDHLFAASNSAVVEELISLKGVGIKTAACVLMFCLQRDVFPVDTHVHRVTGLLGWRPAKASRDETFFHLDARIPEEDKYGLHVLLVKHGKVCEECKAGGKVKGKCELRKAFGKSASLD
jgi:endonuclease-3